MFLCRSVAESQRNLGAQASPSRTRSSNPKVVVDSLVDDAGTATPPPVAGERRTTPLPMADLRTGSPPRAGDVGARGVVGDVGTPDSPRSLMWTPSAQGLLGLTTTWLRTRLRLARRREVRGHPMHRYLTPWKDDIFDDKKDMQALRTSIVTINHALMVGLLTTYFLTTYLLKCC
jgi:hypothetical protein